MRMLIPNTSIHTYTPTHSLSQTHEHTHTYSSLTTWPSWTCKFRRGGRGPRTQACCSSIPLMNTLKPCQRVVDWRKRVKNKRKKERKKTRKWYMYIYVGMREYSGGEGSLPLHALDDPQCGDYWHPYISILIPLNLNRPGATTRLESERGAR